MSPIKPEVETWKRLVLRSMPPPAWLSVDCPHGDVVLSTRVRWMRNLKGFRFPHSADDAERLQVMRLVLSAARTAKLNLESNKGITNAEREYLVGARLVSPEFPWTEPSRAILLSEDRAMSVMINEEDHVRLQALTAGWSLQTADRLARHHLDHLGAHLEYAWTPRFGYLAASPFNAGEGRRLSVMLHLIGLAAAKRLPEVLKALTDKDLVVRGLFGESSRAIGAYVQVSSTAGKLPEFSGAVEYLIREERNSRASFGEALTGPLSQALDFATVSRSLSLADALRVLAWVRWGAIEQAHPIRVHARQVDAFLSSMDLHVNLSGDEPARSRADALRSFVESATSAAS